jgi:hypothetical protein
MPPSSLLPLFLLRTPALRRERALLPKNIFALEKAPRPLESGRTRVFCCRYWYCCESTLVQAVGGGWCVRCSAPSPRPTLLFAKKQLRQPSKISQIFPKNARHHRSKNHSLVTRATLSRERVPRVHRPPGRELQCRASSSRRPARASCGRSRRADHRQRVGVADKIRIALVWARRRGVGRGGGPAKQPPPPPPLPPPPVQVQVPWR